MIRRHIDHKLRREKTNSSPPSEDDVVVLSGGSEVTDSPNTAMLTPKNTDVPNLSRDANDPVEHQYPQQLN